MRSCSASPVTEARPARKSRGDPTARKERAIRSGGRPIRITLPNRVTWKAAAGSVVSTRKITGTSGFNRPTSRPASVATASSSGAKEGYCRYHPKLANPAKARTARAAAAAASRRPEPISAAALAAAVSGRKKAKTRRRLAGPHSVTSRIGTPSAVRAAQVTRTATRYERSGVPPGLRRGALCTTVDPAARAPVVTRGTAIRAASPAVRSRYRSRRSSTSPSRRKKPSWEVSPGIVGPPVTARRPTPAPTNPPTAPSPRRIAMASRRRRPARRSAHAPGRNRRMAPPRTASAIRKNTRWVNPAAARSPPPAHTARHPRRTRARAARAPRNSPACARLASQPPARYAAKVPIRRTASPDRSRSGPRVASRRAAAARPAAAASTGPRSMTVCKGSVPSAVPRTRVAAGTPGRPRATPASPSTSAYRLHHVYTGPSGPTGKRNASAISCAR
jgi:hypothetical protein